MIHDGRHKLIWYPAGNHFQLFDLGKDPGETVNLLVDEGYAPVVQSLKTCLRDQLYGSDLAYVKDGELVGFVDILPPTRPNRGLSGQRGLQYPPIPVRDARLASKTL